jgi:hypothetical protein
VNLRPQQMCEDAQTYVVLDGTGSGCSSQVVLLQRVGDVIEEHIQLPSLATTPFQRRRLQHLLPTNSPGPA